MRSCNTECTRPLLLLMRCKHFINFFFQMIFVCKCPTFYVSPSLKWLVVLKRPKAIAKMNHCSKVFCGHFINSVSRFQMPRIFLLLTFADLANKNDISEQRNVYVNLCPNWIGPYNVFIFLHIFFWGECCHFLFLLFYVVLAILGLLYTFRAVYFVNELSLVYLSLINRTKFGKHTQNYNSDEANKNKNVIVKSRIRAICVCFSCKLVKNVVHLMVLVCP